MLQNKTKLIDNNKKSLFFIENYIKNGVYYYVGYIIHHKYIIVYAN